MNWADEKVFVDKFGSKKPRKQDDSEKEVGHIFQKFIIQRKEPLNYES